MHRQQLLAKLDEINEEIKAHYRSENDIGVLAGISGMAIFQFYYSRFADDQESADLGAEMLGTIIEEINNGYSLPTYCSGIAGAGWALELLNEEDFVDVDCDSLLTPLDDYLIQAMQIDEEDNFYDFLHGVLGMGYYFFKRYRNTKSDELRLKYQNILLKIVQRLENTASVSDDKSKWESYLIRQDKLRGYNLGLAHGICSIISFLTRLASDDNFQLKVEGLIKQSVNYILSFHDKGLSEDSCFPDWITLDNQISESGRLAWCYGDLGMAMSIWQAGNVLQDNKISEQALNILKRTTKRTKVENTRVVDAGICHGSAGLVHIYSHIFQHTQEQIFQQASEYWAGVMLGMAHHDNGYAGYCQKRGDVAEPWKPELSLLEGISGIGLSIISYLSPDQHKWDQCLLVG